MRDRALTCPHCLSSDIEATTTGSLISLRPQPLNTAKCYGCGWEGRVGDMATTDRISSEDEVR